MSESCVIKIVPSMSDERWFADCETCGSIGHACSRRGAEAMGAKHTPMIEMPKRPVITRGMRRAMTARRYGY